MLKLMYITGDPQIALIAEAAGVDRIFVDMETVGKELRQGGMNTVQSHHTVADVAAVRRVLTRSQLLVRVNPIHPGSEQEIDAVIHAGADMLMLPYFQTIEQVNTFLRLVRGRVRTVLLFETPQAAEQVDRIAALNGVDECFIGLNDLHLGYRKKFMFELLADGTVERLCNLFAQAGKPYGFGGIARIGTGTLPAEYILGEHVRLGSSAVILSRGFVGQAPAEDKAQIAQIFRQEVPRIRDAETRFAQYAMQALENNRLNVARIVQQITETM